MPNFSDFYGGRFVKAADLSGPKAYVIEDVQPEILRGEERPKLVVSLRGLDKRWVLNCTNASALAELYGDDFDNWVGERVVLFPGTTDFGGKRVPCIRCRAPQKKPARVAEPELDDDLTTFDDEV